MSNYEIEDFRFGDLIATRSNSFLSRAIRWFMKKYDSSAEETFSHIAVVIDIWGETWIAEALAWGVRIWPIRESGYLENEQIILLRYKEGFTEEKIKALSKKCVACGGIRYQYENFPQWVIKIFLKIKLFRKENLKAIYCSELGAIAINAAYPGTFETPNMTSPADHYSNNKYEIIDKNGLIQYPARFVSNAV